MSMRAGRRPAGGSAAGRGDAAGLRRLVFGAGATQLGDGAWYTTWAIFFTRELGLPPSQAAAGITAAGAVALLAATPMGQLADRLGARELFAGLTGVNAVAMAGYLWVHGFWPFLVVTLVETVANRSRGGVRTALVTGLVADAAHRVDALARMRVAGHIGFAAGSGLGALTLALNTHAAYLALVLGNAATFAVYAAIAGTVPRVPCLTTVAGGPRWAVLRDVPFLCLTVVTGTLALCWGMLSAGLPLWVTRHTAAPAWIAPAIVLVNSLAIVAAQRRVSRTAKTPLSAARAARFSAVALAGSCLLFAASYHRGGPVVVLLLFAAGMVHVAGELLFVAAAWGLSVGLMAEDARGQYQGMSATGEAAAVMLAPILMISLVVDWGYPGWFVLAALFLAVGAPATALTRWALRRTPPVACPLPEASR